MAGLPKPGETLWGFTASGTGTIQMLGAGTVEFHHTISGAKLLYIQNDDRELGFNLIYRTPQTDECDSSHIMEHLLLSSCRKYPSRDIFFDMDSKSYATFMNGLTDNTYTCYPICSQSQDQLIKLMDVLLNCMEEPEALRDKNFFLRECLRLELDSADGPLAMQGTVLSEDWGHLTDIEENADTGMAHTLYAGGIGAHVLGRAHLHYKELTFERVLKTYDRCYHYSNCLMVLYGNMDYEAVLEFLHKEHLSRYPGQEGADGNLSAYADAPVRPGHAIQSAPSPAYEGSEAEHGSIIDYAIDLSDSSQEELIYWDLMADILDNDTSAWHRQARQVGLNNVMEVYLDQLLPKPSLRFRLRNGDESLKDIFQASILTALKEISLEGCPPGLHAATMKDNRLSDALTRESPHLGYSISEEIGRFWSQTGRTDYFQLYEDAFHRFAGEEGQSILKSLAAKALCPRSSALVVTYPLPGMAEQLEEEKERYLLDRKASMTEEDIQSLLKQTRAFREWNSREWGSMDFLIKPQELPKPEPAPSFRKVQHGSITSYAAPAPVDAVGSYQVYFDISAISHEDLRYLCLYQMLLTELDTQRFTVEQQKTLEQEYLHDCTFDELYPGPEAGPHSHPMMSVFWYGLTEGFDEALDFLLDIMGGADYGDTQTIIRVLSKYLPDYDLSKTDNAPSLASSLAEGYIRRECRFRNMLNSQEVYHFLKEVLRRLMEEPGYGDTICRTLTCLSQSILVKDRMVFMAAADERTLKTVEAAAAERLGMLPSHAEQACFTAGGCGGIALPDQKQKLAVCVEAASQETRILGDFHANGQFKGRCLPFLAALADKYLKPAIRYRGGAYDCGIDFYIPTGYFTVWSTADPNVKATLDIVAAAGRELAALSLTSQDLDGYILSTYAQALPPSGALSSRMRHMRRDMAGIDPGLLDQMTADIRNARLEHQGEAAQVIDSILKKAPIVTVGNERSILKDHACFDEILDYRPAGKA